MIDTGKLSYSRARSIKTRIETRVMRPARAVMMKIREQDPLKQGLKQELTTYEKQQNIIREQDPLKQGLKQHKTHSKVSIHHIREQDPLKQGLKLRVAPTSSQWFTGFESKIH